MESIIRNVKDIEVDNRRWIESAIGRQLKESQQVIIHVIDAATIVSRHSWIECLGATRTALLLLLALCLNGAHPTEAGDTERVVELGWKVAPNGRQIAAAFWAGTKAADRGAPVSPVGDPKHMDRFTVLSRELRRDYIQWIDADWLAYACAPLDGTGPGEFDVKAVNVRTREEHILLPFATLQRVAIDFLKEKGIAKRK